MLFLVLAAGTLAHHPTRHSVAVASTQVVHAAKGSVAVVDQAGVVLRSDPYALTAVAVLLAALTLYGLVLTDRLTSRSLVRAGIQRGRAPPVRATR